MTSTTTATEPSRHADSNSSLDELCHFRLYPPPGAGEPTYSIGEQVFVSLRSEKSTGRAQVIALPDQEGNEPNEGEGTLYPGRIRVQFYDNNSTYHVRPGRIVHVHDIADLEQPCPATRLEPKDDAKQRTLVLLCETTASYRNLARSQVSPEENVLEIGSSYGECTAILAEHCKSVVGVEISQEVVQAARERHPGLRFENYDVFEWSGRLSQEFEEEKCHAVFLDIGGNRDMETVIRLIPFVQRAIHPRLIVIKCAELAKHASKHITRCRNGDRNAPTNVETQNEIHDSKLSSTTWNKRGQELGVIVHPREWLKSLHERCEIRETRAGRMLDLAGHGLDHHPTGGRFLLYPLKYPHRYLENGVAICRFHNYGECLKAERCPFDHEHCHYCGEYGHLASQCTRT